MPKKKQEQKVNFARRPSISSPEKTNDGDADDDDADVAEDCNDDGDDDDADDDDDDDKQAP